jgi:hypothetical protein
MKKCVFAFVLLGIVIGSCTKEKNRFELLNPEQTGITFNNEILENDSFNILKNEYMYNGGGVGISDLNNDGFSDVIFTGNKVQSRIYLNNGDFTFTDITDQFIGLPKDQWVSGVTIVDINADGLPDVYFTCTTSKNPEKRKNQLWVNQGITNKIPSFKNEAEKYGIADQGYSVHAAFLDYDLDGDLDLYVMNNTVNKDVPTNYRKKIVDGSSLNNDKFYENNGDGTFSDVTLNAGIVIEGFGLGLAVSDINKDGYPDIYVSNDYISNDLMYINQKDKTFKNSADEFLSYQSKFSMGNDVSDVNSDGNPDIITLDMLPHEYQRKKQTIAGSSYLTYVNDEKYGYQHQYVRNMLQVHNGFLDGDMIPFSEVGQISGIYDTEWSWSPLFADYDNDGDRDLIITNGFPKDLTDKDFTNYKAQMHNYLASDADVLKRIPEVKVSNFTFERISEYEFKDVTQDWGMSVPSYSNGAAFVDLDNDGDLDYIVNNINDPAFIYKNNTTELGGDTHFLKLKLSGSTPNTQAIGAKVEVWSDGKYQFMENYPVRGYISSVDPILHFGLGKEKIDSVLVIWPGQSKYSKLLDVQANQIMVIDQGNTPTYTYHPRSVKTNHLFEKTSLIDYTHEQGDYIDFFDHQNVMPHKFSQIGPCMAQGDLNNDGLQDLLIGASDILPTRVYLRTDTGFKQTEMDGLTSNKECTEADLVIADLDGDGDQDVIAVSGGYRNHDQDEYKHYWYENQDGKFIKTQLPIPAFPASVVKAEDFDGDGDLDLFIGSRIKRDNFPFADPSYLLINEGGKFTTSQSQSFDIGMVTDAIWSDVDGDGLKDLIITREWNSILVMLNNGKELSVQENADLSGKRGMWNTIAAGDFDGDGDEDYIVGNLGENHKFTVSEEYPMRTYAVDIDNNGIIDPIVSSYWRNQEGKMEEYPINGLDELASQTPFFRKTFNSYTEFSLADINQMVNRSTIPAEDIFEVNETSSFILWNNNGSFRWEALPSILQTSPIRKMIVLDLNNDEHLDVVVTGNDYSYDVSTGYYDGSKGHVMLGDGKGGFNVLKPAESGMVINGQVDALLYYKGDTSYLVAGVNRESLQIFRHKK